MLCGLLPPLPLPQCCIEQLFIPPLSLWLLEVQMVIIRPFIFILGHFNEHGNTASHSNSVVYLMGFHFLRSFNHEGCNLLETIMNCVLADSLFLNRPNFPFTHSLPAYFCPPLPSRSLLSDHVRPTKVLSRLNNSSTKMNLGRGQHTDRQLISQLSLASSCVCAMKYSYSKTIDLGN